MKTMGVRELKEHLSEVLREVKEGGQIIEITHHGERVARLVPMGPRQTTDDERRAMIRQLDALAAQISAHWPEGVNAVDAVHDVRREL